MHGTLENRCRLFQNNDMKKKAHLQYYSCLYSLWWTETTRLKKLVHVLVLFSKYFLIFFSLPCQQASNRSSSMASFCVCFQQQHIWELEQNSFTDTVSASLVAEFIIFYFM